MDFSINFLKIKNKKSLVKVNPRKCGPSKWHMMLGLNLVIDDTLNLPGVGCCGAVNTPNNNNNNNIDIWDSLGLILLQKSVGAK